MTSQASALSTIIIEDDYQAREALSMQIKEHSGFRITGMAGSVKEGIKIIKTAKPDVAFLDVELTDGNSFDILDKIKESATLPQIVFTTAWDKYAIEAFKYAAFDYLLKPVESEGLDHCLNRLIQNRFIDNYRNKIETLLMQLRPPAKLRFNTRSGFILINPDDIFYIHADSNYCEIYLTSKQREIVTLNIGKLETLLPEGSFYRISRSAIINLDYLVKVNTLSCTCTLVKDKETVQLKASLKQLIGLKRM